jgi:2,4-dienoyl-CoA reductase-like NADH-dependent reductase (Old Yellow Enzyme family)
MGKLLEPLNLFGLTLRTATVRSATWEGLGDEEGFVRPELIQMLLELVRGSVGMVIPGYLYVSKDGRGLPWQAGVWDDAHVKGLRSIVEAVHKEGGIIAAQIAHAGGRTKSGLIGDKKPMAPSSIEGLAFGDTPREMTMRDIKNVIMAFAEAASRVKEAGFDALQLHAGHGYLLSQFLSPLFNRRCDGYGGTAENRRRFVIEVYEAVRMTVGNAFPVFIKINTTDGMDGGITADEALETVKDLSSRGMAAVEVSGGIAGSEENRPARKGISSPSDEAYFQEAAYKFKKSLNIPVILVGGIKSYEVAEGVIAMGKADLVSLSRALIREPHLIRRWKEGDMRRALCISCNFCLKEGLTGKGIACAADKEPRHS